MKQDPYFKYVAAAFFAGVLLAIFNPTTYRTPSPRVHASTTVSHSVTVSARS